MMAGDVQCHWSAWFKAHYTDYVKAPSDFQPATWAVEHNKYLDMLCKECGQRSLTYFKETQNQFRVKRRDMTISGKPDLVVVEPDQKYTVYDMKTGQPKNSDVIQVMLYMTVLPYSMSSIHKGKTYNGCVAYRDTDKTAIPYTAVDDKFKAQITHFLDILAAPEPPPKTPSWEECQYCEITAADCPERAVRDAGASDSPDLPM